MKSKYKIILRIILPIPFIIGVIGYKMAGYDNGDSLYGSFCYYFVSVYQNKAYNPLMEIARWTAPLMTVTWLFYSLRGLLTAFIGYLASLRRNSVVIYCNGNSSEARLLSKDIPRSFVVEIDADHMGVFYPNVKNQILMFKEDRQNLEFYSKHDQALKNKNVFMKIEEIDSINLRENNIRYFNINENIAASFWKDNPIIVGLELGQREIHIAIIGSGELAEKMLVNALWLNIFYEDQKIVYHVFGDWIGRRKQLTKINTMNADQIILEDKPWHDSLEILESMDRVVVTTDYDHQIIEDLLYTCPDAPIYYYSETNEDPAKFYKADNIYDFGCTEKLFTKDNIMGDVSYQLAKELNYLIKERDERISQVNMDRAKEEEWRKLNGETQITIKSIADYFELYIKLQSMDLGLTDDVFEIVKLEHTRLCRFAYTNNWKYGVPKDGELFDTEKRIHKLLVPYEELSEDDEARLLQRVVFLVHQFKKRL